MQPRMHDRATGSADQPGLLAPDTTGMNFYRVDPALTDPAWDKAVVATGMQIVTTQKPSPFDSRFMLLYDDANLYVGMKLDQTGAPVTATHARWRQSPTPSTCSLDLLWCSRP